MPLLSNEDRSLPHGETPQEGLLCRSRGPWADGWSQRRLSKPKRFSLPRYSSIRPGEAIAQKRGTTNNERHPPYSSANLRNLLHLYPIFVSTAAKCQRRYRVAVPPHRVRLPKHARILPQSFLLILFRSQVPYGAHGYGAAFTLSVMDREYIKGLSLDEALSIIEKCINELHTRFLIAQKNFVIKVRA